MKLEKLILILLTVFIVCSCKKQNPYLSWQEVSGKVKSIRTTCYKAIEKFGEISEGDVLYDDDINNLIEFDKDGNITEHSNFNHRGDLVKKFIFVFDDNGKVIKINIYDGNGDETGRIVYTYNTDNKITKTIEYDKSGKIIYTQKDEWEGDKCVKSQLINEYSEGEYWIYEYNGKSSYKSVLYDKDGKEIGIYSEYENDKLIKYVTSEYTTSITYNEKGLCVSIVNGQHLSTGSFSFLKNESYIYEYEYDTKGNWIRKIEKKKQSYKPENIIIREIEYYE